MDGMRRRLLIKNPSANVRARTAPQNPPPERFQSRLRNYFYINFMLKYWNSRWEEIERRAIDDEVGGKKISGEQHRLSIATGWWVGASLWEQNRKKMFCLTQYSQSSHKSGKLGICSSSTISLLLLRLLDDIFWIMFKLCEIVSSWKLNCCYRCTANNPPHSLSLCDPNHSDTALWCEEKWLCKKS